MNARGIPTVARNKYSICCPIPGGGVPTLAGEGLPYLGVPPRPDLARGGYLPWLGGYLPRGNNTPPPIWTWPGWYLPWPGGGGGYLPSSTLPSGPAWPGVPTLGYAPPVWTLLGYPSPPPRCEQTENITFPHPSDAVGNKNLNLSRDQHKICPDSWLCLKYIDNLATVSSNFGIKSYIQ